MRAARSAQIAFLISSRTPDRRARDSAPRARMISEYARATGERFRSKSLYTSKSLMGQHVRQPQRELRSGRTIKTIRAFSISRVCFKGFRKTELFTPPTRDRLRPKIEESKALLTDASARSGVWLPLKCKKFDYE